MQDLDSPTIEEQVDQPTIDDETVLIVPSSHGFIQATDDIDSESVLPLTTLTGMTVLSLKQCIELLSLCRQLLIDPCFLLNNFTYQLCETWSNLTNTPPRGSLPVEPSEVSTDSVIQMDANVSHTIASIPVHIGHHLPSSLKKLKTHLGVVLCKVL